VSLILLNRTRQSSSNDDSRLSAFDTMLRKVWLKEPCGHLSNFVKNQADGTRVRYVSDDPEEDDELSMDDSTVVYK